MFNSVHLYFSCFFSPFFSCFSPLHGEGRSLAHHRAHSRTLTQNLVTPIDLNMHFFRLWQETEVLRETERPLSRPGAEPLI